MVLFRGSLHPCINHVSEKLFSMKKMPACFLIVAFIIACASCGELTPNAQENLFSYLENQDFPSPLKANDTSQYINTSEFLDSFQPIEPEVGRLLLATYGNGNIPKKKENFRIMLPLDSMKRVEVMKTNARLDPYNAYSDRTYFFLISYHSGMFSYGATWLIDFEKEVLGEWNYPFEDSIKYVEIDSLPGIKVDLSKIQPFTDK